MNWPLRLPGTRQYYDRDVSDEATRHNQAAYDTIAASYAQRQAGRDLPFPDLRRAFAAGMLATAGRVLPGRLVQADLRSIPVASASLDGLWCRAALLHVPENQTMLVLDEIRRALRPGGHLALVTALGEGARLEPVPYAPGTERWFFYRRASRLREQLHVARLRILAATEEPASRHWFKVLAEA